MRDDYKYLLWLASIEGFMTIKANKLLDYFDSANSLYDADEIAFSETGFLTKNDIIKLTDNRYKKNLDRLIDIIYKKDIKLMSIFDDAYPEPLKNIYDPPFLIFYKGDMEYNEKSLAIVGSRKCTAYGIKTADVLSKKLGELGFTIVSGMARGIDSAAHNACVLDNFPTWAVLGCGIDIVYPPENRKLMEKITENGAVMSEFVPGTKPMPYNFPRRNRIISGLSLGVIVIEAGEKSGSLITANTALEQGREVFAVPGNLMNTKSVGTNKLIKDGAKIITGLDDILDELYLLDVDAKKNHFKNRQMQMQMENLRKEEKMIIECLEDEQMHIDAIAKKTKIPIKDLNSYLIILELNGMIEQLPGKIYCLVRELN